MPSGNWLYARISSGKTPDTKYRVFRHALVNGMVETLPIDALEAICEEVQFRDLLAQLAPTPSGRQAPWRGTAVGSDVVNYGHLLDGCDGEASEVVIRLSDAIEGLLSMSYAIPVCLLNRRLGAEWHHPAYQRMSVMVVNPVIVRAGETREIRFFCDTQTDVWMLDFSVTKVAAVSARRRIGDSRDSLKVGAAGGEAEIDVYDVP